MTHDSTLAVPLGRDHSAGRVPLAREVPVVAHVVRWPRLGEAEGVPQLFAYSSPHREAKKTTCLSGAPLEVKRAKQLKHIQSCYAPNKRLPMPLAALSFFCWWASV